MTYQSVPSPRLQNGNEIQESLKQLEEAKSELQHTEDELEDINKEVAKCREEMDRRMRMMVQVDEDLWSSLLELDTVVQEKLSLSKLLQDGINLRTTIESKKSLLRSLQEEEQRLLEEESTLKTKCDAGVDASRKKDVSLKENSSKPSASSQSKSTVKSRRKR